MEKLTDIHGKLLEGCIWDEKEEALYFVDIEKFRIYRVKESGDLSDLQLHTYVSAIVLKNDGRLLAALQDGLYEIDFESKKAKKIMESRFSKEIRYNDGKCDRYGDLWIGSMYIDQNSADAKGGGSLFCIRNGAVIAEYPSYTIPNGLDWSGDLFFHTETSEKKISVYCQKPGVRGVIGDKIDEICFSDEKGSPDGMCADSDGNLWIAMWGGFQVIGYDPRQRKIFRRIEIPDKNVSCCVLGGKEKKRLFITTAQDERGGGGEVYSIELMKYMD